MGLMKSPIFFIIALICCFRIVSAKPLISILGTVGETIYSTRDQNVFNEVLKGLGFVDTLAEFEKDEELRYLLWQVIYLDAQSFYSQKSDMAELENLEIKVKKNRGSLKEFKDLDLDDGELNKNIRFVKLSRDYFETKVQMFSGVISDAEVLAYYQQNSKKFGNLPVSQFKESIKNFLSAKQKKEKTLDWLTIIKRKYRVHLAARAN